MKKVYVVYLHTVFNYEDFSKIDVFASVESAREMFISLRDDYTKCVIRDNWEVETDDIKDMVFYAYTEDYDSVRISVECKEVLE